MNVAQQGKTSLSEQLGRISRIVGFAPVTLRISWDLESAIPGWVTGMRNCGRPGVIRHEDHRTVNELVKWYCQMSVHDECVRRDVANVDRLLGIPRPDIPNQVEQGTEQAALDVYNRIRRDMQVFVLRRSLRWPWTRDSLTKSHSGLKDAVKYLFETQAPSGGLLAYRLDPWSQMMTAYGLSEPLRPPSKAAGGRPRTSALSTFPTTPGSIAFEEWQRLSGGAWAGDLPLDGNTLGSILELGEWLLPRRNRVEFRGQLGKQMREIAFRKRLTCEECGQLADRIEANDEHDYLTRRGKRSDGRTVTRAVPKW
nr:hypothetical protein 7 [Desulfobacterales bacterium]